MVQRKNKFGTVKRYFWFHYSGFDCIKARSKTERRNLISRQEDMGAGQSRQRAQEPIVMLSEQQGPDVNVRISGSTLRALDRKVDRFGALNSLNFRSVRRVLVRMPIMTTLKALTLLYSELKSI